MSDIEEEVAEETLSLEQRMEQILKNNEEMMETLRIAKIEREASDKRIEQNMQLFGELLRELKEIKKEFKIDMNELKSNHDEIQSRLIMVENETDNLKQDNSAEGSTSTNTRRSTILLPQASDSVEPVSNGVTVMFTDIAIDNRSKVTEITLKAALYLTRISTEHNLHVPEGCKKSLVCFMTPEARMILVRNDQILKVPHAQLLNASTILKVSDEEIKNMISRKIRVPSKRIYKLELLGALRVKFAELKKGGFTLANYHIFCHGPVHEGLSIAEEIDGFYRNGATPAQVDLMPTHSWGTELLPGVFRIIMEAIAGHFVVEFTGLLGMDSILACKTLDQFVTLFREVNDDSARESLKQSQREERIRTPMKLSAIKESVEQDREQKQILRRQFTDGSRGFDQREHTEQMAKRAAQGEREKKVLFEEAEAIDEGIRRAATLSIVRGERDPYTYRGDRGPDRISPDKFSGGSKMLACFEQSFTGKCPYSAAQCKYSHDPYTMKEYLRAQNTKILESPNWDKSMAKLAFLVHNAPLFEPVFNRIPTTKDRSKENTAEHVLGLVYQDQKEHEDEMYWEEHELMLEKYLKGIVISL